MQFVFIVSPQFNAKSVVTDKETRECLLIFLRDRHWILVSRQCFFFKHGIGPKYWILFPVIYFLWPFLGIMTSKLSLNSLRPRQNGRHFADDTFKRIFLNGNVLISIKISLKFVPKGTINNIPALVQIMAWRRPGDKPLSEPRMVSLPTHICVTRPQWVKIRL